MGTDYELYLYKKKYSTEEQVNALYHSAANKVDIMGLVKILVEIEERSLLENLLSYAEVIYREDSNFAKRVKESEGYNEEALSSVFKTLSEVIITYSFDKNIVREVDVVSLLDRLNKTSVELKKYLAKISGKVESENEVDLLKYLLKAFSGQVWAYGLDYEDYRKENFRLAIYSDYHLEIPKELYKYLHFRYNEVFGVRNVHNLGSWFIENAYTTVTDEYDDYMYKLNKDGITKVFNIIKTIKEQRIEHAKELDRAQHFLRTNNTEKIKELYDVVLLERGSYLDKYTAAYSISAKILPICKELDLNVLSEDDSESRFSIEFLDIYLTKFKYLLEEMEEGDYVTYRPDMC